MVYKDYNGNILKQHNGLKQSKFEFTMILKRVLRKPTHYFEKEFKNKNGI